MKQIHIFTIFLTPESFFDGQFGYLAEQGHDIIMVCSMPKDGGSNESMASPVQEFCERNHIRFVPVEMPRAASPMAIWKAIGEIKKLIREEKPDAVFGHTPVGALCAMHAAKVCGVRNRVYYRHGLIYTTMKGVKRFVFKNIERYVARCATAVVNVSHSLSHLAVKDGLNPANKQYVIGHGTCGGIDAVGMFNPALLDKESLELKAESLELRGADIVYGFCGRICTDKGVPELVDGFLRLKGRHPEVRVKLLLIGTLDERDILPQRTKDLIAGDGDIVVTGWVAKKDIPYYYSMLDVFVFPSHREGFGMTVVEASAMGKPVLVSRSHGCVDSIVEHVTGEYIDLAESLELRVESICHGMEIMLDDSARRALGCNGRRKVLEWYDQSVMWPLVSDLYREILA